MNAPAITVLMPVFNASRHLDEAVDSILSQTWTDFELLAVDDGSTDDSLKKLVARADPRIRIEPLPRNQGVVAALNHGLALARGALIARMDSDDVAEPDRLARQFAFMQAHPEIGVLGTDFTPFGDKTGESWVRYFDDANLRVALLFENPLCHPTVMIRRSALTDGGLQYPADCPHAEEYALWLRLAGRTRLANLPDRLLRYRIHPGQVSHYKSGEQSRSIDRLVGMQLDALGIPSSARDLRIHHLLGNGFFPRPGLDTALREWTHTLIEANARAGIYEPGPFAAQLGRRHEAALVRHRKILAAMPLHRRLRWRLSSWLHARTPDTR